MERITIRLIYFENFPSWWKGKVARFAFLVTSAQATHTRETILLNIFRKNRVSLNLKLFAMFLRKKYDTVRLGRFR